ncbi:MAG TPA: amidohydrolase family protein [Acidimicrobiia bacterium]
MHHSSRSIRERLDHPVIDADGHCIEFFPGMARYLRDEGVALDSPSLARLLPPYFGPDADWHALSSAERAARRAARPPWWGAPAKNTRDLATAMFPRLLHERLDDFGIDVSVVYPSAGLAFLHLWDERERRGACRALNRANADAFEGLGDRLIPVAAIPMHTPDEAIEALQHAVQELGFKAVLLAGYVQRPVDAVAADNPALAQWSTWIDMYGIDSAYDYDPVWAACRDLGVAVAFHSGSIGWGSRMSPSSYMYNHLGHLAEGQHALAKSLFLGGVTRRFPDVNFAFLEGGVSWAVALYSDLIGHWEKRNRDALDHLDPQHIDKKLFFELMEQYGGPLAAAAEPMRARRPSEDPAMLDEFAACGIERPEDIATRFVDSFYFGCEADDPLTAAAFNETLNPFGRRLHAMFGSDVAHWDVPDMTEVLEEAWEMVDHGWIDQADFRDFVFTNPARFFTTMNPEFFAGTVVEQQVAEHLGGAGVPR